MEALLYDFIQTYPLTRFFNPVNTFFLSIEIFLEMAV
jgi:hypothetical protein